MELHKKKDSTKLCRISIDIDSSCDLACLDIKKAAHYPQYTQKIEGISRQMDCKIQRQTAQRKRKLSQAINYLLGEILSAGKFNI